MEPIRRVSSNRRLPYTIPDCVALQIIAGKETTLSKGDLILQLPTVTHARSGTPTSSPSNNNSPTTLSAYSSTNSTASLSPTTSISSSSTPPAPILLAFVGKTLFPLYQETVFGTFVDKPMQYGFDFKLSRDTSTQVKLVLPSNVKQSVQDEFEDILIERGLLLTGIRAAGDEIMRGARESGRDNSNRLKAGTQDTASAGSDPMTFSKSTHDNAASVRSGSSTVYQYALGASNAVANAAGSAGAGLKKGMNNLGVTGSSNAPTKSSSSSSVALPQNSEKGEDMSDLRKAINEAASGVAEGASELYSTAKESASLGIKHNFGEEANELATSAGGSMQDMGKTAGNAIHSTSVIGTSLYAAEGAVKEGQSTGTKEEASR
ncbi:hypothetical protein CBS101457_003441 [Exobasidium rhododendri]|nr:hypothetical protein CBS101457_003441 [Exobasidium rhododendri]